MYIIKWTDHALEELNQCYHYLQENWTDTQIKKLSENIDSVIMQLVENPRLYPKSTLKLDYHLPIHKVTIQRYNTLYYSISDKNSEIEILSFFSNRQNPNKLQF
ncbi:MAG: type II toxin-antitoxin system RelE/ParE family toxin [Moraxellaceae bacterium]|nr:type II toxin-antitoxin system RelE/ParE family toxin [Moraxellaceae bacterium]